MAFEAITDMVIKKKKRNVLGNRTWVAHTIGKHATNSATVICSF
jgi:hypothetical protein